METRDIDSHSRPEYRPIEALRQGYDVGMISKLCATVLLGLPIACAQAPNQVGIAHAAFRVADLESTRSFYQKLGFEQFFEMKQGERTTEAFLKINDHQFIELYPRTAPSQELGLMHLCYESSDLAALHAAMAARGVAVSDVRKAGAGNLLMTMKDPEGQTIEFTQYMPGSRHFEDRGKHLGTNRVADRLTGAATLAHDVTAMRNFYIHELGFQEIASGPPVRLRLPDDSGQEVDILAAGPGARPRLDFGVADLEKAGAALARLGMQAQATATSFTISDPDGVLIVFEKLVPRR